MGGSSGIALVDNLNPFHRDENVQGTVGNFLGSFTDNVRDNQRGIAAIGGFALGMGALGAATAAEGAAASSSGGYLGFTSAEAAGGGSAAASGTGYLGANTAISGTGMAAAELGGAGASSAAAINYSSGYLGANIGGLSSYGSAAGSGIGYLGADVGIDYAASSTSNYLGANIGSLAPSASESAGLMSYLPSGKDAISYATALGLIKQGDSAGAAKALSGTALSGYVPNINIETPNMGDTSWLSGLLGSGGAKNQSGASYSPTAPTQVASNNSKIAIGLALVAVALFLAKKKRMI